MRRTQIYLSQKQVSGLRAAARTTHQTVSAVIRRAIDDKLERNEAPEFVTALHGVTGLWAGRRDLETAEAYVRRARQDRRGQPKG